MSSVSCYEFHGVKSTSSTFLLHCRCDSVIRRSSSRGGKKRRKRLEIASADISSSRYAHFPSGSRSEVKVRRSSWIETRKSALYAYIVRASDRKALKCTRP